MERTIINAFGLYLPPLSLVLWKTLNCTLFNRAISPFRIHMHAPWTYCNAREFKCSQVAYLLIWSRASVNHLYLHLQRYVSFKAGPAQIISTFLEFHMTALMKASKLVFIFIALVFLTWATFDIDSLKREWALEMGARYGPAPAAPLLTI